MVVVTVDNFEASRVVVKRVDKKVKVFYNIAEEGKEEKLEKLEIVNDRGTDTVFPVVVNGFRKELNYTSKKWTGNYRLGLKFEVSQTEDKIKMQADNKKKDAILKFYDVVFNAVKDAMKKDKQVCPNPVMAEMLEPFVKFPCKHVKGKPIIGDYDFNKDPSIWAKPFYELPKDYDKEKKPVPDPEDITVKIPIFNEFKESVNHTDLENKQFKAFYKLQLYG